MNNIDIFKTVLAEVIEQYKKDPESLRDPIQVFKDLGVSADEFVAGMAGIRDQLISFWGGIVSGYVDGFVATRKRTRYTARAARLNARPRKAKRHGERRGL